MAKNIKHGIFLLACALVSVLGAEDAGSVSDTIADLQHTIQSATEQAIQSFQNDPSRQEETVAELTDEVSKATVNVITLLIQNTDNFDTDEVATQISSIFENVLTTIQRTLDGKLDIDSVVIQIYEELQDILNYSVANKIDSFALQKEVKILIEKVYSNGLQEFFQTQQAAQIQPSTTSNDRNDDSDLIIQFLQSEDLEGALRIIEKILLNDGQLEVAKAFQNASEKAPLSEMLVPLMLQIYVRDDFPMTQFSNALGAAYKAGADTIVEDIGNVLVQLQDMDSNVGMVDAMAFALSQEGEVMELYKEGLVYAIFIGGCTSVAQLLIEVKTAVLEKGAEKTFQANVEGDQAVTKCMKVGDELQVTMSILDVLDEPEEAFIVAQEAAKKRQDAAIAMSIIRGMDAGKENEVISLMKLLFTEEDSEPSQLALQISLMMSQGDQKVVDVILKAISQLGEGQLTKLADAFAYAFQGQSEMRSTFESLFEESIVDNECGVKPVLNSAFSGNSSTGLLNTISSNPRLAACLEERFKARNDASAPIPEEMGLLGGFTSMLSDSVVSPPLDASLPPSPQSLPPSPTTVLKTAELPTAEVEDLQIIPEVENTQTNKQKEESTIELQPAIEIEPSDTSTKQKDAEPQSYSDQAIKQPQASPKDDSKDGSSLNDGNQVDPTRPFPQSPSPKSEEPQQPSTPSPSKAVSPAPTRRPLEQKLQDNSPYPQTKRAQKDNKDDCDDIPPPSDFSCKEQALWGKCDREWMTSGDFCRKTCGQCVSLEESYPQSLSSPSRSPSLPADKEFNPPQGEQKQFGSLQEEIDSVESATLAILGSQSDCVIDDDVLLRIAKIAVEQVLKMEAK
eukprot:TRINITY_DN2770_c1_g2_i1.p1 TRINITY_DN2770_c1_g2~~TRINITY_DN2770_c1_g2_i1.p1  ORF type:complete len:850 (-),score=146.97 TRINITY_DN2770_c1_g2_i1:2694-5243(-)